MAVMTVVFGDDLVLDFVIENSPIADAWLEKMHQRDRYALDDPRRFYGFNHIQQDRDYAEQKLRDCISAINQYQNIITRSCTNVYDQEFLNYLHNIFERYHGRLDQQHHRWWQQAPDDVKKAMANLNLCVNRAESVKRGNQPRFVCTWFNMPKKETLTKDMVEQYGTLSWQYGGIYLNYVEIGKTLEELAVANDKFIAAEAFKPFLLYSADFCARFYDKPSDLNQLSRYFEEHRVFFEEQGITSCDDYRAKPWRYKVAQLRTNWSRNRVIKEIRSRQVVTSIQVKM